MSNPHSEGSQSQHSFLVVVSTSLLVGCFLLSTLRLVVRAAVHGRLKTPDPITVRSDQRFAGLRAALPTHGVVGYVDPLGRANPANYYLAQYALAPLLVDYSTAHPLVIGNFPGKLPPEKLPPNMQLITNFGNGVFLFANKDVR